MKNWYIVQTFSGFEQKVAETLKDIVKKQELNEKIENILIFMKKKTPNVFRMFMWQGRKLFRPIGLMEKIYC